jgi:hypothetical protein
MAFERKGGLALIEYGRARASEREREYSGFLRLRIRGGGVAVFSLPSLEGFGRVAWLAEFIYVNEVSAEVVSSQTEALVVG